MGVSDTKFNRPEFRDRKDGYSVLIVGGNNVAVDDVVADRIEELGLLLKKSPLFPHYWQIFHPDILPKGIENRHCRLADWIGNGCNAPKTRQVHDSYFPKNPSDENDYRSQFIVRQGIVEQADDAIPSDIEYIVLNEGIIAHRDGMESQIHPTKLAAVNDLIGCELKVVQARLAELYSERGKIQVMLGLIQAQHERWKKLVFAY